MDHRILVMIQEMVFHVRGFRGAHLGENKMFFADFPKLDPVERNVAHLNLATRDITVGAKLENGSARQHGNFVIQMNTTKKSPSYWENVVMEVRDGRTLSPLWPFPLSTSGRVTGPPHAKEH